MKTTFQNKYSLKTMSKHQIETKFQHYFVYKRFRPNVTPQIRVCDQPEATMHLCLRSLDLLKFRHDLTRLGRLPTCKSCNSLTVIHHTTCTQMISIVNYKFTYITSKCIQHYQSSIDYLCDVDYNNTIHNKRNNTRRHQMTVHGSFTKKRASCQK